jgi:glucokinase
MSGPGLPRGCVLGVDIGGTKTALALASVGRDEPLLATRRVESRAWSDFEALAADFLGAAGSPALAAVAIAAAGPVEAGAIQLTNLPWRIDARRVAERLRVSHVALLNDLEATALGMLGLPADAFALLQGDRLRRPGTLAVLAAGTGLGEAVVLFDGDVPRVLPSEGGQVGFAPRDAREVALLLHLAGSEHAHVPVESVVSGPGLVRIHEFLRARESGATLRASRAERSASLDAAAIAERGATGADPICAEALEIFVACYGSAAGDLALHALAHGGVWLGGGIAPKLLPVLRRGGFLEAFRAKGRFREWLAALPVAVCLAEDAALRGALRAARRLAIELELYPTRLA